MQFRDFPRLKFEMGVMGINTFSNNHEDQRIADLVKDKKYEEIWRAVIMFAKNGNEKGKKDNYVPLIKYADVKRYALTKAFSEINGFDEDDETYESIITGKCAEHEPVGEIRFFYELIRRGRGNKVSIVRLYVPRLEVIDPVNISSRIITESKTVTERLVIDILRTHFL